MYIDKMSHYETKKVLKYVKKGSVSKLRTFLKKNKVDLSEIRDSLNKGVLHLSCYLGDSKMSRYLLRNGVDPCVTDDEGNTPLHIALKYALEFNNKTIFMNLIVPLTKKSKRVMNLANKHGETPQDLYEKLREALRSELLEDDKLSDVREKPMEDCLPSQQSRFEEQDWFEKLAYEEACEDFYFKQDYDQVVEEEENYERETYDHWAERIRREYNTKHQRVTAIPTIRPQEKEQEKLKLNETLTKKLTKEHEEYFNKVKQKRIKREREKYEENCQKVFESGCTDELTFESIPWPCLGSAADIVDKISEWAGEDKVGYLKMQRVRWHPDRFAQRCRHRLKNTADMEQILNLVNEISQGINMMISSL